MANLSGPAPHTQARVVRVRELLGMGWKLSAALVEAKLNNFQWYRWAGWKRSGGYQRTTRVDGRVIDRQFAEAVELIRQGWSKAAAIRETGINNETFRYRAKRAGLAPGKPGRPRKGVCHG